MITTLQQMYNRGDYQGLCSAIYNRFGVELESERLKKQIASISRTPKGKPIHWGGMGWSDCTWFMFLNHDCCFFS